MGARRTAPRRLKMQYAGGLVKHLGLQMYSGAVPAIAELVANSWDADAKSVKVTVPFGKPTGSDTVITVQDTGTGMSFEEVDQRYLVVGLDRRFVSGDFTPGGRRVMGRKGLGKLAGFGIAHLIEVWTVKDGRLTAFQLDYDKITRNESADFVEPYSPPVLHDRNVRASDPIQRGTLVILKRLQLKQAVNADRFRQSMARRFAVLASNFTVSVNGKRLRRQEMELEFRFPTEGTETETVPGIGEVRWWMGFTRLPIKIEDARGVAVLAHGKLAQAPFFFDFSKGAQGQVGMQYMTGEVEADSLDEDIDLIATDRASVLWEDPRAEPLLLWGQDKIRHLLREWAKKRQERNVRFLRDTTPYMARIERFSPSEQIELTAAIQKLAAIPTIEDARLTELVDFLVNAYANEHFMNLIRALNAADERSHGEIFEIIAEWDILEAIAVAQVVRGRVEVIRTFDDMIKAKTPEKPYMQDFLKEHPWLIDPGWQVLRHEKSLDKILSEHFDVAPTMEADGRKRLDFFCLADSLRNVVVEVKRPGDSIGRQELAQIEGYVDFLETQSQQTTAPERRKVIQGYLICTKWKQDALTKVKRLRNSGIYVVTWTDLLETAERLHFEFLDVVKARAPKEDPRIERLDDLLEGPNH